ncbi:DUF302 domain-containing protein [Sessilibacter sp. MAH4]
MKIQTLKKVLQTLTSAALILIAPTLATAGEKNQDSDLKGMITIPSSLSFSETSAKLQKVLEEKGMTLFTVVDHAKGAASVGIDLTPTSLFIFGNPKAGSPLMQCSISVALDLPQKILITESKQGIVSITYNDPHYLAERHTLTGCENNIEKISAALNGIANAVATNQ